MTPTTIVRWHAEQRRLLGLLFALVVLPCCGGAPTGVAEEADTSPVSTDNLIAQASLQAAWETTEDATVQLGDSNSADADSTSRVVMTAAPPCGSVTTVPSPLDPSALPADYTISWAYEACPLHIQAVQTGHRSVHVERQPDVRTRVFQSTRQLTFDYFNGDQLVNTATNAMRAIGDLRSGIQRGGTMSTHRERTRGDGTTAYRFRADYTYTFTETYENLHLVQRDLNGSGVMHHQLSGATTQVTYAGLVYQPGCCYPIAGLLTHIDTTADGHVTHKDFAFTSRCGVVEINHTHRVTYPSCTP